MKIFKRFANQSGQGMTEYIIIVALIAIAAIAAFTYFGNTVRNQTTAMTQELAGQDGSKANTAAAAQGTQAASEIGKEKTLKDYADSAGKVSN